MRRSSASCNSLSDLNRSERSAKSVGALLLPVCESSPCLHHEELQLTSLHLDNDEPLHLPKHQDSCKVDEYLASIPRVASRSEELLSARADAPHHDYNNNNNTSFLNVLQGEVAHASSLQADFIVSADATTCHVVALRSTSSESVVVAPLVSMAHVDKIGYEKCLDKMVVEHVKYHEREGRANREKQDDDYGFFVNEEEEGGHSNKPMDPFEMEIHMLGGFLDPEGKSQSLSTWLLTAFSKLANDYQDLIKMKLVTAAISSMNTSANNSSPLGRGLGIQISTGTVFCVNSIPKHVAGPALEVRNARAFQTNPVDSLHVIHDSNSNELCIEPFAYQHYKEMDVLARLPNETLLQITSTSPQHETDDFCDNLRNTLGFIKRVPSCEVFGKLCNEPLVYRRTRSSMTLNEWALCS